MNGDGLRAPLETGARESTPWDNRTICRDGLRAPLETSAREQTPWGHRIEPGANDPRTWRDRAISGGGLRARTGPGTTTQPAATGDDRATKYTRGDIRGKWLELRQRLRVDAPLPLEPSLTIPKTALATMMVSLPHLGEDVMKRGPPEYLSLIHI